MVPGEEMNELQQDVIMRPQAFPWVGGTRLQGENISSGFSPHYALAAKVRRLGRNRLLKEAELKFDLQYRKLSFQQAVAKQFKLIKTFSSDSGRNARVSLPSLQ